MFLYQSGRSRSIGHCSPATPAATAGVRSWAECRRQKLYHAKCSSQIRLDAEESRPWQRRDFKHPELLKWVRQNRSRLVIALLTMARAWYAEGQPQADTSILGGFEDWSRIVGGILSHAGINGFLGNLDQMYDEADDEGPAWTRFLTAWRAVLDASPVTVSEVTSQLNCDSPFRRTLPDELAEGFLTAGFKRMFGNALRKRRNRRYGPHALYVERAGEDSHSKVARWRVRGQRGPAGSPRTFAIKKKDGSTKKVCGEGCQTSPLLPALPAATQTEPLAGRGGSDE